MTPAIATSASLPDSTHWGWQKQLPLYLLYLALLLATYYTQDRLTYQEGQGWDGRCYVQMAAQLHDGEAVVTEKPFSYRLGTPWLVALLPGEQPLTDSFLWINLFAILCYPLLFIRLWRSYGMSDGAAWLFIFIFTLSWHASPRFNFFYPATPDPWLWLFVLLLLPDLSRPRLGRLWYPLLLLVGVLFRELVLWIALAAVIGRVLSITPASWRTDRELRRQLIALLCGGVALLLTHLLATGTGEYTLLRAVIGGFWHKPFPVWINGWFGAFGLLLIPALASWHWLREWVRRQPQAAVWLVGIWILGWCAGTDTIRIVYWSAPFAFLLLYDHYHSFSGFYRRWWVIGLLLLVQLLSQRWGTPIPDYDPTTVSQFPLFAPQGLDCPYLDLEPQYAPHWVSKVSLIQYLTASLLLLWGFRRWRRQQA